MGEIDIILKEKKEAMGNRLELHRNKESYTGTKRIIKSEDIRVFLSHRIPNRLH